MESYTLLENPRRGRRHHRRNPSGGEMLAQGQELLVDGVGVGIGIAGTQLASTWFPTAIKSNKFLDFLTRLATAAVPLAIKDSLPGGARTARNLAGGMAANAFLAGLARFNLRVPFLGPYFPSLPANAGGGGRVPSLAQRQALLAIQRGGPRTLPPGAQPQPMLRADSPVARAMPPQPLRTIIR